MEAPLPLSPEQQYMAVDGHTLRSIVKLNFHRDADIVIRDGKVYVVLPLDLLFDYRIEGEIIYIKPKVFK